MGASAARALNCIFGKSNDVDTTATQIQNQQQVCLYIKYIDYNI